MKILLVVQVAGVEKADKSLLMRAVKKLYNIVIKISRSIGCADDRKRIISKIRLTPPHNPKR